MLFQIQIRNRLLIYFVPIHKDFLDTATYDDWKAVEVAWSGTRALRKNELFPPVDEQPVKRRKTESNQALQLETYLKSTMGYTLVLQDFDAWYPDADS